MSESFYILSVAIARHDETYAHISCSRIHWSSVPDVALANEWKDGEDVLSHLLEAIRMAASVQSNERNTLGQLGVPALRNSAPLRPYHPPICQ